MTNTQREFEKWHGSKLAECRANNDKDMHSFYTKQKAILELGFKAALAHSQQVSVERLETLLDKHGAYICKADDVWPVSDGDILISQENLISLIQAITNRKDE